MELYFKDLENEEFASDVTLDCACRESAEEPTDTAEEVAFAELAERVSAARLVY